MENNEPWNTPVHFEALIDTFHMEWNHLRKDTRQLILFRQLVDRLENQEVDSYFIANTN